MYISRMFQGKDIRLSAYRAKIRWLFFTIKIRISKRVFKFIIDNLNEEGVEPLT